MEVPTSNVGVLVLFRSLALQLRKNREGRIEPFIGAVTSSIRKVDAAMCTHTGAILVTERLDRHRQSDHLSKEIVQMDHGSPKPARLEVLPQPDTTFGESSHAFQIIGFAALRRLEHQPKGVAERMRVALGAAAALQMDVGFETALQKDVLAGAHGVEYENEWGLDFHAGTFDFGFAGPPPGRARFEAKALSLLAESFDLNAEIRHRATSARPTRTGGGPGGDSGQ